MIVLVLFIKVCNNLPCHQNYDCNIWLYLMLNEEEFNGTKNIIRTRICTGNIHMYMDNFLSKLLSRPIKIRSGTYSTE